MNELDRNRRIEALNSQMGILENEMIVLETLISLEGDPVLRADMEDDLDDLHVEFMKLEDEIWDLERGQN